MDDKKCSRQTFLLQMTAGFTALVVGCGDDGDGSSSTTGDTDPTAASMSDGTSTSSGSTSTSSGSTSTSPGSTGDPGSTGEMTSSSGGSESGSDSSGGGSESGSDSSTGGEANVCLRDLVIAEISLNHGHALEIPMADIIAGVEVTYDASGAAGHCHAVTLTAEDFATLRAGGSVTKISCNGGDHEFVISCVDGARPPGDPAAECAGDPNFGACS